MAHENKASFIENSLSYAFSTRSHTLTQIQEILFEIKDEVRDEKKINLFLNG
jgi:hypothetical protein